MDGVERESDVPSRSEAKVSCRSFAKSRRTRRIGMGELQVPQTCEGAGGEVSWPLVGAFGGRAIRAGLNGGKSGVVALVDGRGERAATAWE